MPRVNFASNAPVINNATPDNIREIINAVYNGKKKKWKKRYY